MTVTKKKTSTKNSTIDREEFLSVLELVSPGLSTRGVAEDQSSCFAFVGNRVYSFNDEMACSAKIGIRLSGAVEAEKLKAILRKMKEADLGIVESKKEIILKGKSNREVGLNKQTEIQLALDTIEVPKRWKPLPDSFGEAIEFVQDCVDRDEANFPLTCIHLTSKFVEAFDNFQFARHKIDLDIRRDFLIRQPSLKSIISLSMTEFSEGKEWIHFRNSDDLMLSCRRWVAEYKDMNKAAVAEGHNINMPTGLIDDTERAAIFSENNDNKSQIRIDLTPGLMMLRGDGPFGWYKKPLKVKYTGNSLSFMIHPQMMIRLLKRQTSCQINEKIIKIEFGKKAEGVYVSSLVPVLKGKKNG